MSSHKNVKIPNLIPLFSQHKNWQNVRKIIRTLNSSGAIAYLAGGCVRDALLNQVPKDFDVATSARPEDILRLFPNSNKQGKAFGVVAVFHPEGQSVEVATFRKDGPYTDGRHPEYVEFLSEKEDALRRDFTVNALFYDLKKEEIIDYVGGVLDLQKKIIRTVGEPEKRFQEDHLRILRAMRFSIRLYFEIDSITKKTLLKMKDKLFLISRERIYEECLKMLKTGNFMSTLTAFKELSLLQKFYSPLLEQVDWPFCLHFWKSVEFKIPSYLRADKNFLWTQAFYPLLIQTENKVLNVKGKWDEAFSCNLKEWKFPISVLRVMNDIFYFSCCLLDIRPASFGKKMRILNSDFSESVLFLSKHYLKSKKLYRTGQESPFSRGHACTSELCLPLGNRSQKPQSLNKISINMNVIDEIQKEFLLRAPKGQLPDPLIKGNDLKVLGVSEDKGMADMLEYLYDFQLEKKIIEKEKLLKVASSLKSTK
ncbi:MAG: CCA tRNA nucleotidyltransferase [Bdellovibrionales bacterium]|nr:CCA tRNA nucleotidyltransferase [Bdellovibrionales bacterium]